MSKHDSSTKSYKYRYGNERYQHLVDHVLASEALYQLQKKIMTVGISANRPLIDVSATEALLFYRNHYLIENALITLDYQKDITKITDNSGLSIIGIVGLNQDAVYRAQEWLECTRSRSCSQQ